MIQFNQVYKRYPGGHEALKDVSCGIAEGEMVYLTGHSGAGKSTLLKLVAAIERPTSGSVLVKGQNIRSIKREAIPALRRDIGLIFQDHKLLFDRNAFDNVLLPLQICGFDPREAAKRVRAALDKVGLLAREKANPVALSGGEQQRLCIARAIVNRPNILLADEPTGNLDRNTGWEVLKLLEGLREQGITLVVVTHDAEIGARAQRQIHMLDGRIVSDERSKV